MEMMAENLGYNRAYLSKLFKEHTGITPVTFLLRLRLDNARRMLRERLELTVEQIAFSVGFRDPLYFFEAVPQNVRPLSHRLPEFD